MAAISAWSEHQLATLLEARPDLVDPQPRDLAALVARAATWASTNECMCFLNQATQQVLETIGVLPQPTTVAALASMLGVDPASEDLAAILEHLTHRALVFRVGNQLRQHPQLDTVRYPAGLGPPACTLLASTKVSVLQEMARHLGVTTGTSRATAIDALSKALADPEVIVRAVRAGPAGTANLVNNLATLHPVEAVPGGTYYVRSSTPVAWLLKCGLAVSVDWDKVVMPREVGLALRGGRTFTDCNLRPPLIRWQRIDANSADRASRQQALDVVADVATILDRWQEAPPRLLKAGGLGIRDVRRAAAAVGRSETDAARLIDLAAVAGLAGWDTATDTALPRPAYDDWLALDGGRRWGLLATAWLTAELHVNLAGALGANQKPIPPLLDRWPEFPAGHRRSLVLTALEEGEAGHAPQSKDLDARVAWDAPVMWTGGPAMPETLISWVREEATMLGLCASGALSSLGRSLLAGRIDDAAAEVTAHSAPLTAKFVVQADLTAVATGQLPVPVRSELELLGTLESSGAATVFRFSEASLRRAFDGGRTAGQIIQFLEAHATKGVPQPLSYLIEDIGRRHGGVRVGSATCYLRSEDPALLAEMYVAKRLAKLQFRQLAPTVLISDAAPEVVIDTLRATGYLPALEDSTGTLVLARPPIRRAMKGPAPTVDKAGPMGADDFSHLLDDPRSLAAFRECLTTGGRSVREKEDVKNLVRKLRAPKSNAMATGTSAKVAARRIPQPAPPGPPTGSNGSVPPAPVTPPISQLKLPDNSLSRPSAIARTDQEIRELLELAHSSDWLLRIEYSGQKGRIHQINATIFSYDDRHADVGTVPGYGTRTLALSRIRWARAMTEAEEYLYV